MLNSFGILLGLPFLLACSNSAPQRPVANSLMNLSLSVQLSRTSLFSNDFEQYRLSGNNLYYECGNFARENYKPREQKVLILSPDQQSELANLAQEVIGKSAEHKNWDAPGKNDSIADPGRAILSVELGRESAEIKTSLDALVESDYAQPRELVRLLRTSAQNPCGSLKFFGL